MVSTMTEKPAIYDRFYKFIDIRGGRSFVEIEKEFGGSEAGIGDLDNNIVYWHNIHDDVRDAITYGQTKDEIVIFSCSPLIYATDGVMLNMPLAINPPKNGYKEFHWAPSCVHTMEWARTYNEQI